MVAVNLKELNQISETDNSDDEIQRLLGITNTNKKEEVKTKSKALKEDQEQPEEKVSKFKKNLQEAFLKKLNEKLVDEKKDQDEDSKNRYDVIEEVLSKYKLDLFDQNYLNEMISQHSDYKVRVYLLTCQNLSAVDNFVKDNKNWLAGNVALSSANPYPIIKIGSGENDPITKRVKIHGDRTG